jgi:hypothetical protein
MKVRERGRNSDPALTDTTTCGLPRALRTLATPLSEHASRHTQHLTRTLNPIRKDSNRITTHYAVVASVHPLYASRYSIYLPRRVVMLSSRICLRYRTQALLHLTIELDTENVIFAEIFDVTRLPESSCKIYKCFVNKTVRTLNLVFSANILVTNGLI